MFLPYTQQIIQADATGIFLLALLAAPFVIPAIVKKTKISEAEEIKNSYPEGFRRVMRNHYIDYQYAKEIVNKRSQIVSAQREYEEEQRKAAEERRIREKAGEIRRACPFITQGKSDIEIVEHEHTIYQLEKRHNEREARAKKILQDYPQGSHEVCGYIPTYGRMADGDIDKLINNENTIRDKQKEHELNKAELDRIWPEFIKWKKKYPLGIMAICKERGLSTSKAEDIKLLLSMPGSIAEKHEQRELLILGNKQELEPIIKRAKDLTSRFDKDHVKGTITRSYGESVAEKVMGIIKAEEEFQTFSKHLDVISKKQNDFAQETRNIFPKVLNGWGWYKYNFKLCYSNDESNNKSNTLTVWQVFNEACCFDDSVSYEFYPRYKDNRISKTQIESAYFYNDEEWDRVLSFLLEIKNKYGEDLFVILANTDGLDDHALQNNYRYIREQLNKADIKYGESILTEKHDGTDKKYVVIDVITDNSNLIQYCSSLFHYRHIVQRESNDGTTGVVFITMLKCYDGAEVEELNKKIIKEKEDAIRKAKEEEEQRQKDKRDISEARSLALASPIGFKRYFPDYSTTDIDSYRARQILQKKSNIKDYESTMTRLKNCVSSWDTVRGVPHYFFYYYYPTRFTDISADSYNARKLIYNFKDGVAHNTVKDLIVGKIRSTFNQSDISKMCFACIPASTKSVHQSRYKVFSQEVCRELGMADAYDYITITKEKTPSHLGGNDSAEYSYDRSFFNGKFVVLFDDIVTRGDSVSSMKTELEALGAKVVCAVSIGRTFSDWNGNTPKPHPYTGRI